MHCLAFSVNNPAVSEDLLIRSALSRRSDCREQRRLEPASVLIRAFEIEVARPFYIFYYRSVRRTGVKPAVERVRFFCKVSASAFGAYEVFGNEFFRAQVKPGVRALLAENLRYFLYRFVGANRLFAVGAVKYGYGKSPMALTGNTPVGSFLYHGNHSRCSPFGYPFNVVARLYRRVLERVNRAEPLRRCSEYNRVLASPAVRILMHDIFKCEE